VDLEAGLQNRDFAKECASAANSVVALRWKAPMT